MKITFIKDHPSGLKADSIHSVDSSFGQRMIDNGYAVEVTEAPPAPVPPVEEVPAIVSAATETEVTEAPPAPVPPVAKESKAKTKKNSKK